MPKLDLKKELKELYSPSSKEVSVVTVPAFNYIMFDGQGKPDGKEAKEAFEALFPVAYTLKFMMKAKDKDYGVMPAEGLWWADDMGDFEKNKRDKWKWTYMIMQPDFVTKKDFKDAISQVKEKKSPPGLSKVRFEKFKEGKAAQILHIGPFSEEGPKIQMIHEHIKSIGGKFKGQKDKHHEIYLSDIRRTAPEKLKTVIRQPFH